MRSLFAALAVLVLPAVAGQPPVGCRVLDQYAPFIVSRTMAPAEVEPTSIQIDICIAWEEELRYENRAPVDGFADFAPIDLLLEAAFDPGFSAPIILPVTLTTAPQHFDRPPYDGVRDYAGTSGETRIVPSLQLIVSTLSVADGSFFTKPWQVWFRTSTTGSVAGLAPMSARRDTHVSLLGMSVTYQ